MCGLLLRAFGGTVVVVFIAAGIVGCLWPLLSQDRAPCDECGGSSIHHFVIAVLVAVVVLAVVVVAESKHRSRRHRSPHCRESQFMRLHARVVMVHVHDGQHYDSLKE